MIRLHHCVAFVQLHCSFNCCEMTQEKGQDGCCLPGALFAKRNTTVQSMGCGPLSANMHFILEHLSSVLFFCVHRHWQGCLPKVFFPLEKVLILFLEKVPQFFFLISSAPPPRPLMVIPLRGLPGVQMTKDLGPFPYQSAH